MSNDVYRIPVYMEIRGFIEERRVTTQGRIAEISGSTLREEFGFDPGRVEELRRPRFDLEAYPHEWIGAYDLVYADYVLEHVPDPREAVRNIGLMLRPGGWACLTTAFLFPIHEGADHGDFWRFSPASLETLFKGWADVRVGYWGNRVAAHHVLRWRENNHSAEAARVMFAAANDPEFPVLTWVWARRPGATPAPPPRGVELTHAVARTLSLVGDGFLPQSEGWYLEPELRFLRDAAASLPESMGPLLEVGCYKGLSTSAIAQVGPVTVVDDFRATPNEPDPHGAELRGIFLANMARMGYTSRVCLIEGDAEKVLPTMSGSFRLVHLDGSHQSPAVDNQIAQCWRLVAPGGMLVLDDVDWPDVGRAASKMPVPLDRFDKKVGYLRKPNDTNTGGPGKPADGGGSDRFFDVYDDLFFAKSLAEPRRSQTLGFGSGIARVLRPQSAIDIGGGVGLVMAGIAREMNGSLRGVCVESPDAVDRIKRIGAAEVQEAAYFPLDLRTPAQPDTLSAMLVAGAVDRFDVAVCAEVGEHLQPESAKGLVGLLCGLSDTVVFTAAPPGQGGDQHLNEQPWTYWRDLFASSGYVFDADTSDAISGTIRDASSHVPWYVANLRVYRRNR